MDRFLQVVWIAMTLASSWLAMMVFHELGHVTAARFTGGRVVEIELLPWTISRTDVVASRAPMLVVWAGPILGVLAPLAIWIAARMLVPRWAFLLRFFLGFCLVANGAYLFGGALAGIGDAGDLLRRGASLWQLMGFGFIAMSVGIACWHGLGRHFGLGKERHAVSRTTAVLGLIVFVLLAGAMTAWGQPPVGPRFQRQAPRVALGYYPAWGTLPVEDIPWQHLTHLAHAFLRVDPQGRIVTSPSLPNRGLTAEARKHDVRTLLSIGGGDTIRGLERVTASEAGLNQFVAQVVSLMDQHGYDGIDLDWEYPRDETTRDGFSALARALRGALDSTAARHGDGRRYQLTAAIAGTEHFGRWLDGPVLEQQFDFLNVMCYDLAGPWSRYAAHHAPLRPAAKDPERRWRNVQAVIRYWRRIRGLPKEKLCLGIPCYGRRFPAARPFVALKADQADKHEVVAFSRAQSLLSKGWRGQWDHDAHAAWLVAPDNQSVVAFDDRSSVRRKAAWARKQGLRGVFFWSIDQDRMPDKKHWLLEAANQSWPK